MPPRPLTVADTGLKVLRDGEDGNVSIECVFGNVLNKLADMYLQCPRGAR